MESITPPPAPSFRRHGNTLLVSGQVGVDENWRPVNDSFQVEARAAFRNVWSVLAAAGTTPDRILKITTYLADTADFAAFNEVWMETFPGERPARTTIGAQLHPPFRIELDVIASVDSSS